MRVLVFGSRTWVDRSALWAELGRLGPSTVIEGEARGADTLARQWAQFYRRDVARFPVTRDEWNMLGKSAGHVRNRRMHRDGKPDKAIGFISGKAGSEFSRGSQGMHDICALARTPLRIFRDDGEESE